MGDSSNLDCVGCMKSQRLTSMEEDSGMNWPKCMQIKLVLLDMEQIAQRKRRQ